MVVRMSAGSRFSLLFGLALALALPNVANAEDAAVQWKAEVNEAWKEVNSNRPLLLYVTFDGCIYCRKMDQDVYANPEIARALGTQFVTAKIDRKSDPQLVQKLGVRIYPTTVIIDHDAQILDTISGYLSPEQFQQRLARLSRADATTR